MILGTMIISSASMSFAMASQPAYKIAEATEIEWETNSTVEDIELMDYEMPSFADYMKESKDFMKKIDKGSEKKLKALYEEAIKLEKADKYDEAMKKWEAFYKIFDTFVDESKLEECTFDDEAISGDILYSAINISFEDHMKELKTFLKEIPAKEMTELKSLYEKANKYVDEKRFEKADKLYDEFYNSLDKYFKEDIQMTEIEDANVEMPSYKDYMKDLSDFLKPVSEEDQKSLERLYKKAVSAEKEGKYEDAGNDWMAFDKILDKYFKDEVKTQ